MPDDKLITLSIEGHDKAGIAHVSTMLAQELTRAGVPVTRPAESSPRGTKSGVAVFGGSLVISGALSAVAVRGAVQVILAFIRRGAAGEITVKNGDKQLTIGNASHETERMLAEWLTQPEDPVDGQG